MWHPATLPLSWDPYQPHHFNRNLWNLCFCKFLVNASAMLLALSTFSIWIGPRGWILSRNQKYFTAMWRVRGVIFLVLAIESAPELSSNTVDLVVKVMGSGCSMKDSLISWMMRWRGMSEQTLWLRATNSASTVLMEISDWSLETQMTGQLATVMIYPVRLLTDTGSWPSSVP